MKTKIISILLLLSLSLFGVANPVKASSLECNNRFLTLVNPVRSRQYWQDKSLTPINSQYQLIKDNDFAATWLVQYDVLKDKELMNFIKTFDEKQEAGLLLEVSDDFAYDSEVVYKSQKPWTDPSILFLSGYTQKERIKLIDKVFTQFKEVFGYLPGSVGAWWIDSYSLAYMDEKYGIDTVMIVADQKTTDHYGVWGQWWGVPYYPSKYNLLTPSSGGEDQADYVVIQWAQRDLAKAYGDDYSYSNYSLQANDYIDRGLDTEYFKELVGNYLNCNLPLGQVTVGLETGIEGATYINEYEKQLEYLKSLRGLKSVTMSDFFSAYKEMYDFNPEHVTLGDSDSEWVLTPQERSNELLGDNIRYTSGNAFSDYFVADKNSFLNRSLIGGELGNGRTHTIRMYFLPIVISFIYAWRRKSLKVWVSATAFLIAAYGLMLRSGIQYGWRVFYGTFVNKLDLTNLLIVSVSYFVFFKVWGLKLKKAKVNKSLLFLLVPLSFGLDPLVRLFRYTNIEGKHYLGITTNTFNFYGMVFPDIKMVTLKLPHLFAETLLKVNFEKVWSSFILGIYIYPLAHIVLAVLMAYFLGKVKPKLRFAILVLLTIFLVIHYYYIFTTDPRLVVNS